MVGGFAMEPTTAIASVIATYILPEAFKEGGKALGKGASEKVIQLINTIQEKFTASGIVGLLTRAEENPTKDNIKKVEGELETQMQEDDNFANTLKELVKLLQSEGVIPTTPDNTSKYKFDFHKEVKGSAFGDHASATYKEK